MPGSLWNTEMFDLVLRSENDRFLLRHALEVADVRGKLA